TGATGEKGDKGDSITGEVVDNGDGTHTITITDLGTGSVTTTIVKDGKNGKDGATGATGADGKNAEADVKDNGDGTHTVTIKDGNGNTTTTIVKDGKNAEADVKDNGDGTHTVTIKDGNGNTTTAIIKDGAKGANGVTGATGAAGKNAEADVKDNGDGTHTVTIKDGNGNTTTTIIKDGATGAKGDTGAAGKNAEADVKDNGDGTHTVTIKDGNGNTTTTIVKDGKNAEADVKDNGNGTHTVTIKDGNGNTTTAIIKDGATGAKGDTGATGADGKNAEADVKDNGNGTHTVTIKDGNGNTTTTIIKDGATGAKGEKGDKGEDGTSITGEVVDNGDGTHTITITDLGTGSVTTTIVKDGKNGKDGATGATGATGADGKNAEADVKDNGNGTHTVTIKDGNGNTTTTIVKDGKDGKDGVMTWDIKSTGNTTDDSESAAKTIKHKNTVDMVAGKNLTVKQTSDENGAKVEFALNSTVTNLDKVVVNGKDGKDGKDGVTITAPVEGKDGKDGSDGKVGISGKDGKDAVSISGKDGVGQIGLTGPKGKDGKDGASINITTDNGKQTLVNREVGADGKPGETTQRIIYVPTDKDGNPLKDENGNTIKREVATMDDGLVFGGNTGEAHKAALGTQVNVKGADANTDWNKFDGGKNIMTQVNGDTITVGLAKDLNVDNVDVNNNVTAKGTISAPTIKAGDTTIKNGVVTNLTHHIDNPTTVVDDKVLNITDEKKKEAATVRDVLNSGWNLQANGKPVDAVTHGNNVNFASDKGTVTVKANSDGKTSVVNLDVNVDNDTITVNNKGQLVANGATNFNVATKDGGNKVAKKGGSSTTKITAGKTITYTAGKNIAIEQNGGDILVSTTNDVNHNSVTTNDLTVNKGGNIDMGGNQIHNVKAGTKDTDAVNVSQLKQSIGDVHKRINKVGKEARGGIAGANAAAGLPQVYIPGKSMVAASAGTFKGESAVAVGYSRSSDNGKVIFKLQGNANTQGDVGGSVGVGYQW
uniref:collagen-flanked surface repeat-containing protein n=1 Tax=Haemophilus sp. TaxID=740 RepID=UPI003AF0B38F